MSGEYSDYKRSESDARRDVSLQRGFRRRQPPPVWKTILKFAYWLSTPILSLAFLVGCFLSHGVLSSFAVLGGILLVFVVIPLLFWLVQKHTDV